MDRLKKKVEVK